MPLHLFVSAGFDGRRPIGRKNRAGIAYPDYALLRRLARTDRIAILEPPVLTSSRRWERLGVVRNTLVNQLVILACQLGVAPEVLARW